MKNIIFTFLILISPLTLFGQKKDSIYTIYPKESYQFKVKFSIPYGEQEIKFYLKSAEDVCKNLLSYTQNSSIVTKNIDRNIEMEFGTGTDEFQNAEYQYMGRLAIHGNKINKMCIPRMNAIGMLILSELINLEIDRENAGTEIDTLIIANCKNLTFNPDKIKVKKQLVIINSSFEGKFILNIDSDTLDKVVIENCDFTGVRDFEISNAGRAHIYYRNCLWPEKMRLKMKWYEYAKAAFPKDFFHYPLRRIDTLFLRYSPDYNDEIPSEENKTNLYRECMSKLRRYQKYASEEFDYELADSIYRTSKDLETYYYQYLNEKNRDAHYSFSDRAESWVYHRFNSFMGWFCGYGTLPIDSIYNSVYIILFFAVFYIIFPTRMKEESDAWDFKHIYVLLSLYSGPNAPLDTFFRAFQRFKTDRPKAGLRQFLEAHTKENLIEFRNSLPAGSAIYIDAFLNSYENKNRFLRVFLWFYAYPFLIQVKLLHLLDRLGEKRFHSLHKTGRQATLKNIWSPAMVLTASVLFISWLLVRIPQGMFISINAFSTLGFGHLPLRGLCKYLAVIEGLIGWFTLSLFSITYVNILMR